MTKRAARPYSAFQLVEAPIPQDQAEFALGREISDEEWAGINFAYQRHQANLRALNSSKASRKKDDRQGWLARQTASVRDIEAAMERIERVRNRHGDFLDEASENHSIQQFGHSAHPSACALDLLTDAYRKLISAVAIVERAEPLEIEVPTEAEARKTLVSSIFEVLKPGGAAITNGRSIEVLDECSFSMLTGFEQLIYELEIHEAKRPETFARWVRSAVTGGT